MTSPAPTTTPASGPYPPKPETDRNGLSDTPAPSASEAKSKRGRSRTRDTAVIRRPKETEYVSPEGPEARLPVLWQDPCSIGARVSYLEDSVEALVALHEKMRQWMMDHQAACPAHKAQAVPASELEPVCTADHVEQANTILAAEGLAALASSGARPSNPQHTPPGSPSKLTPATLTAPVWASPPPLSLSAILALVAAQRTVHAGDPTPDHSDPEHTEAMHAADRAEEASRTRADQRYQDQEEAEAIRALVEKVAQGLVANDQREGQHTADVERGVDVHPQSEAMEMGVDDPPELAPASPRSLQFSDLVSLPSSSMASTPCRRT